MALIYYGSVALTFTVRHPLLSVKIEPVLACALNLPNFAFNSTDSMKSLRKTWDLTVL